MLDLQTPYLKAAEEIAKRFMSFSGFQKHDFEVPTDSSVAVIKFDGRYPEQSWCKTRNRGSDMLFFVLEGEVELFLLDGQGSSRIYMKGETARVPQNAWYVWMAYMSVAGIAMSIPAWKKQDQEQISMNEQNTAVLSHMQAKGN